jgi:hypothetical protein
MIVKSFYATTSASRLDRPVRCLVVLIEIRVEHRARAIVVHAHAATAKAALAQVPVSPYSAARMQAKWLVEFQGFRTVQCHFHLCFLIRR